MTKNNILNIKDSEITTPKYSISIIDNEYIYKQNNVFYVEYKGPLNR